MEKYVDLLIESMLANDESLLPLAPRYRATENGIPASLSMFTAWRLVGGVNQLGQVIVDESRGNVFVTANVDIGGKPATFWARLRVEDEQITEVELYHAKSRGEGGFVLSPEGIGHLTENWTKDIPEGERATREELEQLARAVFIDTSLQGPEPDPGCILLEQGGIVYENADFLDLMNGDEVGDHAADETATIQAGLPPHRPSDPDGRIIAIDEEQGIVVVFGLVPGFTMPAVNRAHNESAFVPAAMFDLHARTILPEFLEGRSVIENLPVTCYSTHVLRLFSGRLQGMQMFNSLTGAGASSVWKA